jgi:hypothetical protein
VKRLELLLQGLEYHTIGARFSRIDPQRNVLRFAGLHRAARDSHAFGLHRRHHDRAENPAQGLLLRGQGRKNSEYLQASEAGVFGADFGGHFDDFIPCNQLRGVLGQVQQLGDRAVHWKVRKRALWNYQGAVLFWRHWEYYFHHFYDLPVY